MAKIPLDCLLCVTSDGSYSNFNLIDGTKYTFSFNLHTFEKMLESQLGLEAERFIMYLETTICIMTAGSITADSFFHIIQSIILIHKASAGTA